MTKSVADLKLVILCGGRGSRLMEETESRPKPLVEIGGYPILWHIMKYYSCFGVHKFVLALGYKGSQIKRYFSDYALNSSDFTVRLDPERETTFHKKADEANWEVTCVDTGLNTLKGGRLKRLESFLTEDEFLLTYGDGIGSVNIGELYAHHVKCGGLCTLTGVRPPSRFGELELNGTQITDFIEKPQLGTSRINGGFFVFSKSFLSRLTTDEKCDLEFGPLNDVAREGQLHMFRHDGFWQCMDNIREKMYLDELWEKNEAPWKIWD